MTFGRVYHRFYASCECAEVNSKKAFEEIYVILIKDVSSQREIEKCLRSLEAAQFDRTF